MSREVFYRYYEELYESGPKLAVMEFPVNKHTPKGSVIEYRGNPSGKKFILQNARKRFAHPDKDGALEAFIHRKARQRRIYLARAATAESCIELAKRLQRCKRHCKEFEALGEYDIPDEVPAMEIG